MKRVYEFEKKVDEEVTETENLINLLRYEGEYLKIWVGRVLATQEKLMQKLKIYKEKLRTEVAKRVQIEKQQISVENERFFETNSEKSEKIDFFEEIAINTNQLFQKLKSTVPAICLFQKRIGITPYKDLLAQKNFSLALLKLTQFTLDLLSTNKQDFKSN